MVIFKPAAAESSFYQWKVANKTHNWHSDGSVENIFSILNHGALSPKTVLKLVNVIAEDCDHSRLKSYTWLIEKEKQRSNTV